MRKKPMGFVCLEFDVLGGRVDAEKAEAGPPHSKGRVC